MKVLYLDCGMGAAGDMLSAALMQLVPDPKHILDIVNGLTIPGLRVYLDTVSKCGISGARYKVIIDSAEETEGGHRHYAHHLSDVNEILSKSSAPEKAISDAKAVYNLLAEAEAKVHGQSVSHIHFHEVGSIDAIADILTVCILINELAPERIYASAVHVGSGMVNCAHGVLPVPAPATAELLRGIPIYSGDICGELCTPTGAALLRYFVDEFDFMPQISIDKVGYGMGKRDYPRVNCLRAVLGSADSDVIELCCNVDDMSGEEVGFALEKLLENGALDAYWEPIGMKKSRPGMRLWIMCKTADRNRMVKLIFRLTSTIGIREAICRRYVLKRSEKTVETPWGSVRYKSSAGFGVNKRKSEFEDVRAIADKLGISIKEARAAIE